MNTVTEDTTHSIAYLYVYYLSFLITLIPEQAIIITFEILKAFSRYNVSLFYRTIVK